MAEYLWSSQGTIYGERRPPEEHQRKKWVESRRPVNEFFLAALGVALVTGGSWFVHSIIGHQSVALLYLLLVVTLGLKLNRAPVLTTAAVSAILWNFVFVPPRYTFYIEKFHDGVMFVTFFAVALAMGHLTSRLRRSEIIERQRERRTAALYELAHQAAFATDLDSGLRAAVNLIEAIFAAKGALLLRQKDHTLSTDPHPASSLDLSEAEKKTAALAYSSRRAAGKFTDVMPDSIALHLPLQGRTAVMGVLSVYPPLNKSFDLSEKDLLEAFAVLIGLVLEKDHIIEAYKHAEIMEASERLQRSLLEIVSHELKTPLAAVQAGVEALSVEIGANGSKITLQEIQLALRRLHRVINNLLNMTRIESGVIRPKLDWCDIGELIQAAIELAGESLSEHRIRIDVDQAVPMVKADQPLLEQCLCNLLLNSAAASPSGTEITVSGTVINKELVISVTDEGKGIRQEDLNRIFEMFYRGAGAPPGGTGLGLAIVDGFARAHVGSVRAANREKRGAEFIIRIPVETLPLEMMENFA
jgi:two-component system sensor histidine kinase KdpD